jgi:hypothetical protein
MKTQARKVHVARFDSHVQAAEDQTQPLCVLGLYPGLGPHPKEALQTPVSEALDGHTSSVTYYVTGDNPLLGHRGTKGSRLPQQLPGPDSNQRQIG